MSAMSLRHRKHTLTHSHEELWRGRVVARGSCLAEPVRSAQFLALEFVGVSLSGQPVDLLLELLYLVDEMRLLVLQHVLLLHALVAARLRVAPILQGSAFLLQADHLVLGEAPQVSVELPYGHGHQLVVGEAVLHAQASTHAVVTLLAGVGVRVVMVVTVVELLVGPGRGRRRAVEVLTVVVVVMVVEAVGAGVTLQVVGVMRDRAVLVVVLLLLLLLLRVAVVVMRAPVSLKASCLQLLLHMRGRRVPVGRGTDQSLHRVFGRQA